MTTIFDDEKNPTMQFDFPDPQFIAETIDTDENKYDGSSIVDIVAESENIIFCMPILASINSQYGFNVSVISTI